MLDPAHGPERRRELSAKASDLGHSAHQLADQVKSRAVEISNHPHAVVDQAHQELHGSIQSLVDRAREYANHISNHGQSAASDLSNRAKKSIQRRTGWEPAHSSHSAGITIGTLGALVVGAGAMYFFDPERGRGRRARAEDKISSWARRSGKSASRYGRHVGNQVKGVVAEAKKAVPEEWSKAAERATDAAVNVVQKTAEQINSAK
jgi:gas vesicle protein